MDMCYATTHFDFFFATPNFGGSVLRLRNRGGGRGSVWVVGAGPAVVEV